MEKEFEIFGTIGPSCNKKDIILEMKDAGMTGLRLNLSHGSLSDFSDDILALFKNKNKKNDLSLLIDLVGSSKRIGKLNSPLNLEKDKIFSIPIDDDNILSIIKPGDNIFLDDGKIKARVNSVSKSDKKIDILSLSNGVLSSRKSIKIEGYEYPEGSSSVSLSEKDTLNIKEAEKYGVSAVMLPFTRSAFDIINLKKYLSSKIRIFAKIEDLSGVKSLDEIIKALDKKNDMIVIARGDLGNSVSLYKLPKIQKEIEEKCKKYQMPYLIVTELLSSMINNPYPTRAEVSDVYHAIYHGASALMLTNETAVGKYPVLSIKTLKEVYNSI